MGVLYTNINKMKVGDLVKWNEVGGSLTNEVFIITEIAPAHTEPNGREYPARVTMELVCNYFLKPTTTTEFKYIQLA